MSAEFFDAIKRGDKGEVERLVLQDPGLTHTKENGLSPILLAAYHHQPGIASILADKTVAIDIFEAAATGKFNNIIRLLARDPELVNAYAEDGSQPLGLACFFGHLDAAEYLVRAGAPINAQSRNGLKAAPLQSAAAGGHAKIVKMLIEHNADPNVRGQGNYTPLHTAAQNGNDEIIRILIYGAADLTVKNNDGKSPLDLAMEAGHAKATLLLGEGITRRFRVKRG